MSIRSLACVVAVLLSTACSADDSPSASPSTPSTASSPADEAREIKQTKNAVQDRIQGNVTVDQEIVHPGGTSVKVNEIVVEGNAVYLDIEAFNGSGRGVTLGGSTSTNLSTSGGRTLPFRSPEENSLLSVPDGGELKGRLAFVGRLAPGDVPLTFKLNWGPSGPDDAGYVEPPLMPSFKFDDLPIPGGSA